MPSSRPQAAFEPIPPDLDLRQLVESTPNFEWVTRIPCDMINYRGLDQFERLVLVHVILGGKPLVIEGYENRLDRWTFTVQWLRDNHGQKVVDVRELNKESNVPMTMEHYLKNMGALTNQWTRNNYKEEGRQRLYLKDMDCPQIWHEKLKDHMPLGLFYLNESTGDIDGLGAVEEPDPNRPGVRVGRGAAKAGDLMSCLPKEMRAENLMCYIGHEGTYTPAHREMCASLGQNIMVEASKDGREGDTTVRAGSSIWFMTESKEREVVSEYWLSRLGHDIEVEKHFAQINAWKQAPFKTYVVEQKPGDFILIPPLAPHQVWNRGTRTMKVAWNRTTVETLEMALNEALFKARFVCRDEQYKNKAMVYYTLQKYSKLLRIAEKYTRDGLYTGQSDLKVKQLEKDFKRLHAMYTRTLLSETFLLDKPEKKVEMVPFDSNITCSYCRCNIFNRFLTCPSCVGKLPDGEDDTYDICMECYAMGRSCLCISKLQWVEQFEWSHLTQLHDQFRKQIISIEQKIDDKSPKSLTKELDLLGGMRTLAQICQVELLRRPWNDISKPAVADQNDDDLEHEDEIELDINGNVKKMKKARRSEKYIREHARCHVDCYWEPKWKQAHCSKCDKNYCYGNLFRAYDMMPQDIMADPNWKCPSCRKICGCRHCKNKPGHQKYTPKGTLLGHNTKAVADARSVESLVDFSHSNIAWIQKAGDDHEENTLRLMRRRKDAELAKSQDPQLGDDYVDETSTNVEERILQLAQQEGIPIDPALADADVTPHQGDIEDEDAVVEHPEIPQQNLNSTFNDAASEGQWVPEGGVMWDSAHAYDTTDAIVYIYPDPAGVVPAQAPPVFVEGHQPVMSGHGEPRSPSPGTIEMVDRKRKRSKQDDGDKPYYSHKQSSKSKTKKGARKSLVVRLLVDKNRLAEIDQTTHTAQAASDVISAPVVGTDLQALNHDYQAPDAPVAQKNVRVEQVTEDDGHDDEFTPGRYRDRRKPGPDGALRPPPDADITRRTTRTQAVVYADPSDGEDEFNEVLPDGPVSKLATMEKAIHGNSQSSNKKVRVGTVTGVDDNRVVTSPKIPTANHSAPAAQPMTTAKADKAATDQSVRNMEPVQTRSTEKRTKRHLSVNESVAPSAKTVAEAQANRQAKMAAIEGISERRDGPADTQPNVGFARRTTTNSVPVSTNSAFNRQVPRSSLPSTEPKRGKPAGLKPAPRSVSLGKVSAADWSDSSSDDDTRSSGLSKAEPGFVTVNGTRPAVQTASSVGRRRRASRR